MIHKVYSGLARITACGDVITNQTQVATPETWDIVCLHEKATQLQVSLRNLNVDNYHPCPTCKSHRPLGAV